MFRDKEKKVWFLLNGEIYSQNQPHLNGLKIVFDSRNIKEKIRNDRKSAVIFDVNFIDYKIKVLRTTHQVRQ